MDLKEIKAHWEQAGRGFPTDEKIKPTSRDPYLAELERINILDFLKHFQNCLEIGSGDGGNGICYSRNVGKILLADISISLMRIARANFKAQAISNANFVIASILDIGQLFKTHFDCIISQRCIINLPTWQNQKEAIRQIHSCLCEGGIFLVSEGFQQELNNVNEERIKMGLGPCKSVEYNRFLERNEFESFIKDKFKIIEIRDYGFYLFMSRILHPLLVYPEPPKHDSHINKIAQQLAQNVHSIDFTRYSYNLFYALQKI